MLERTSIAQAIRRSWGLTDQVFWKMLGTLLLVTVIINVASSIVTAPVQVIGSLLPALLAPTGDVGAMIATAAVLYLVLIMVSLVISAIALVIQSATTALLYIDQRMRKEGLDLELARYVEARQTGATDVADPYVALPGGGSAGSAASPWA
jgi:membrane-anchored glycerophosphoryl diester phosphodiesterase (GDPDase)